ncbi:molybdopterin biosynthesis protein [Curtanaerobium respiraculi]|uniref:molybdopterin biosynthesis protein n=1 Tax=Curtanaerobium respiraculi TaxID=2949669 RepID=UPI0024B39D3B|nr:molybdopterin biosynthesis protein [Curtanaerobium respiraculi]
MIDEPSLDSWLAEAKRDPRADSCGMYLCHNGVARRTPKAQVRRGETGLPDVRCIDFSYDAAGVAAAEKEALAMPGIYYVRTWLAKGERQVGDSIMYVLIGGDIRPHVVDCLQALVGKIKNELVVEKEIYVE